MIPFSTNTLILNSGILSLSGDTLFINGIPLFSGYVNNDGYIIIDNSSDILSFNRFLGGNSGISLLNTVAHSSNISTIGECSASYNDATAFQAFDQNAAGSVWQAYTINGDFSISTGLWYPQPYPWIQYKFNQSKRVQKYSVYNKSTASNEVPIRDWDLSGSKDGIHWFNVDTRSGEHPVVNSFVSYDASGLLDFYSYYRLIIKSLEHGTSSTATLGEISLYGSGDKIPLWSEINGINSGDGVPIYVQKDNNNLYFASLTGLNGIQIFNSGNTVYFNYIGSSSGSSSNFNLSVDDSVLTGNWNLTGINGTTVYTSGNQIIIYAVAGTGANISVNSGAPINGIANFIGAGNTSVTQSGNDIVISSIGGGSSVIYRSYGWYTDQVYSGNMIGAIYRIEMDQNISGFFANSKYSSDVNLFMDLKISPTITGSWTSLFSGSGTLGKPVIPVGQRLSTSGILIQNTITGGYYLRFDCLANSTGNGVTSQLTCYY